MLAIRLDQFLGRNLDAEIDDVVAVVGQDDLDQVLADVVDVALDRREHDFALADGLGLVHVRFEMRDRGLHRLGRLQHLGDDHLVGVEQPPDLVHPLHQRAVDDFERAARSSSASSRSSVRPSLRTLEDVEREAFVERQRACAARRVGLLLRSRK